MRVYIFGNQDLSEDNKALKVCKNLGFRLKNVQFVVIKPNEDLPPTNDKQVVIMDTIQGIGGIRVLNENDLDNLIMPPRATTHDYDLGFQLRYLKKLGKLKKVTIIGIPAQEEIDYRRIQLIFKKLVAQDIQGS